MVKKKFLIGRYQLGWRMVNLYADPNTCGASFNLCRNQEEAQIHVGMDYKDCSQPFSNLCHEVWEMAMEDALVCFRPKAFEESCSDIYHFFFNHNQHTEISSKSGYFIWQCMDDFKRAYAKIHKKKSR